MAIGGIIGVARVNDPRYQGQPWPASGGWDVVLGGSRHMCILDSEDDLLLVEMHLEDLIAGLGQSAARPPNDLGVPQRPSSDDHPSSDGASGHLPGGTAKGR